MPISTTHDPLITIAEPLGMSGNTFWIVKKAPFTLMSNVQSNSCSSLASMG